MFDRRVQFLSKQLQDVQSVLMKAVTEKQVIDNRQQELMQQGSQAS